MEREAVVLGPTVVRFGARTCELLVTTEYIRVTPKERCVSPDDGATMTECCCPSNETGHEVIVRLDDDCIVTHAAFRICYATTKGQKNVDGALKWRIKKTKPVDCGIGVAMSVVRNIRDWAQNDRRNEMERRILFIVNPKAGKGRAASVFEKVVKPVMHAVLGWRCDVHTTMYAGHCQEIIRNADSALYTMIGILGGDGTIHEALQGLLGHVGSERLSIPLVPLPVGSGNALAHSMGISDIETALYAISKERTCRMDILSVHHQKSNTRTFSFLGVMYGMLASADIESENLRCLGDFRFTIGALRELIRMQSFRIKLAYLPFVEAARGTTTDDTRHDQSTVISPHPSQLQFLEIYSGMEHQGASQRTQDAPGGSNEASACCSTSKDTQPEARPATSLETGVLTSEVLEWFGRSSTNEHEQGGPGGWIMAENFDTRLMAALNLPYIAKNVHFMPRAGLADGALHLLQVPSHLASRSQMLKLLLKCEAGSHLDLESVQYKKIKALLFSPEENASWLTVDGEVIPSAPIAVELLPNLIEVIHLPPAAEAEAATNLCP